MDDISFNGLCGRAVATAAEILRSKSGVCKPSARMSRLIPCFRMIDGEFGLCKNDRLLISLHSPAIPSSALKR